MPAHLTDVTFKALKVLAAVLGLFAPPSCASAQAAPLRTLTTVGAVHTLSNTEAARAYPVNLNAVVTVFDPYNDLPRRPIIMVTDATASIYVGIPGLTIPAIKPGTLVNVTGISNPGDFGPSILQAHVRPIGPSTLPAKAPRQSLTHLLTGSEDAQWVELEAIVKSFEISGMNVTLKLALADGEMAATAVKDPAADYASLVDSKILIRGIAASLFNRHSQIFGTRLFFPGMESIHIEEPGPARPFELPISPIRSLMQYHPQRVFTRRVHIQGTVTLFWPGRMICVQDSANVQDDSESLCAETAETAQTSAQTSALTPGDLVDLIGFPQIGAVRPTLSDAVFLPLPRTSPLYIASIDANQAFSAVHDSQLVQMEGTIIAHDRASSDPTIVVTSGNFTFSVILPKSSDPKSPDTRKLLALQEGSRLKLTGICSVQADSRILTRHDGYPVAKFFQIMLRSSSDVSVLEQPSWWNAEHTLRVLAVALIVTMIVLIWSGFLRARLKQQTELLRYQATHDGLTGIWNRKAVLDLLRREFEQAARANQCIGVMMLDADHFKRVNDTYGHLAGDAVLKELARRIQESVRSYDLTGRYGGEEFLIVLPGCCDDELFLCADRIRAAIAGDPITAEGTPVLVTVSVGTAVLDPLRNTEKDALAAADSALYEAKHSGRNRVVSADLQPKPATVHA